MHTRLIDEVWEWKIQRILQIVREMGAETIVEFFPWAYFEDSPGNLDWQRADRILRHADNQGLRVIARMGLVPAWARESTGSQSPNTLNTLPHEVWDDFAPFVAAFAARYQDKVKHLIVWNEPNLAFEWGHAALSPDEYVELLRVTHNAVRQSSPHSVLLAAGPAPTLEPVGSPHGINDLLWMEEFFAAGAANWIDGLALHSYGFAEGPEAPPARDRLNFRRLELQREVAQRHSDEEMALFLTETGWNDDPHHEQAVSPARRIRYTLAALEFAGRQWPLLENLCFWALRYPTPTMNWRDGYTLITPEFLAKPIYYAIQNLARGQENGAALWLPPPVAPS
ncbi:MAG: beta-galactosidase [Anaerolineae bacterium]|nr:beta-galactosidase [Anaerolineae bacterium]